MSDESVRSIGTVAAETAVEVGWAHWSCLTTAVSVDQPRVWTIVDPEALILLSLTVRDRERRLNDLLAGWARVGSTLLSVQRLNTLARDFPPAVREQVSDFARSAADAGDRRWRSHAADREDLHGPPPREKELGPLRLLEGPALMLRLRAGIGVGAKADLLTVLLGLGGAAAELKTIALAAGYSDRAMRTAAEEMARARFIHEIEGPRRAYRADPQAWGKLLEIRRVRSRSAPQQGIPPWRFWSGAFAFLSAVICWEREAHQAGWSSYVASSRARDLVDRHGRQLRYTNIAVPGGTEARGADYLDAFRAFVQQVSTWTRRSLRSGPVANPARSTERQRRGSLEGEVVVPDLFFEPLPPEESDAWGQ
ncbi:MarR family transcriptional regulator [soil metagenome]